MAKDFEKENKCQVKIDFIPHRDTYVKVAKEQETREGHDITFLFFSKPQLHHEDLETLGFMDDLGKKLGGWYDLIRDVDQVDGRWVAMPFFYSCMPMTYREDLYQQAGIQAPKTWEEWKDSGKKIKDATGKKVGIALNQTEDANISLYALLWSYGASTANKERRVTINSPETRKAMEYMKELYQTTMTDEVLSWDDASNNQAFLGGEYSWVHNAVSIYYVAKEKVPDIFKVTNHTLTPHGPGGQHAAVGLPLLEDTSRVTKPKNVGKDQGIGEGYVNVRAIQTAVVGQTPWNSTDCCTPAGTASRSTKQKPWRAKNACAVVVNRYTARNWRVVRYDNAVSVRVRPRPVCWHAGVTARERSNAMSL